MRTSYKKVFKEDQILNGMLQLRRSGWTYMSLALLFGVDYSSIYHQCKKFHALKLNKPVDFSVKSILRTLDIKSKKVKMYEDYLRESGYKKSQVFHGEECIY